MDFERRSNSLMAIAQPTYQHAHGPRAVRQFERVDRKLAGIAVHIAARISASAGAGQIRLSSTVKDLVAGSGIISPISASRHSRAFRTGGTFSWSTAEVRSTAG